MKLEETESVEIKKKEEKIEETELKERKNNVSNMLRESPKPPHAKSECVSTISTQVFFF